MVDDLAADRSVDLIVLPEACDGASPEIDNALTSNDLLTEGRAFVADLARRAGAAVVGGSMAIRHDDGRLVNACFVADRAGHIVGEYAKRRLFATEADHRTPGRTPGVFDLGGLRVGVLICADLWFPELARESLGQVDVICVPAKTTVGSEAFVPYARQLWWALSLTRAVENVLPVVVSDWAQQDYTTHVTAGVTSVNDPAGRPDPARVQRRIEGGRAGVLVSRIDLDAVAEIRHYRQAVGLIDQESARE